MKRIAFLLLPAAALLAASGCVASNLTQLTEALSKDPATACMSVGTPYGTLSVARANAQTQGTDISATGGGCSVKNTVPSTVNLPVSNTATIQTAPAPATPAKGS